MRIHRSTVVVAIAVLTLLLLSGCDGICKGSPASIFCPNNPPEGTGEGTGGGTTAGPACNACDDGQGGTLQGVGEHCGGPYMCCQGLMCVGAMASTMGTCQGTLQCVSAGPALVPLTTTRLRAIAAAQGIGTGQSGITLNRTIGLAFENWVLTMLGQIPRNTMSFFSSQRQAQNPGGLPASVIPEFVSPLALFFWGGQAPSVFPQSEFWEVKAVTGTLTPVSNRYQILGLIDVASKSPAAMSTLPKHPPPTVVFTITGNTVLSLDVLTTATQANVAIWVQVVFEDATIMNDPNPDLYIGPMVAANPNVYPSGTPVPSPASGAHSKLTAPTTPPMVVPGDPDPPEVD